MSNPTWPSTLPPPVADNSAGYQAVSNAVRSNTEAGVAKVRRRFTAVATPFNCNLKLTQAQYATLITFYETTLLDVLPFDWTDWRTGVTASYRFVQRPGGTFIQGSINRWLVNLQLEKLP
jgi:hypothetical protein